MQESTKFLFDRVSRTRMVKILGMAYGLALDPDNLGRNAYNRGTFRHFGQYDRVGADHRIVSDLEGSQKLGAGSDQHIAADRRMTLVALAVAGSAERNAVVDRTVVPDFGRFSDYDTHTVIDKKTRTDLRTRMNLNAGPEPGAL